MQIWPNFKEPDSIHHTFLSRHYTPEFYEEVIYRFNAKYACTSFPSHWENLLGITKNISSYNECVLITIFYKQNIIYITQKRFPKHVILTSLCLNLNKN